MSLHEIPTATLALALAGLFLVSAFFSGAETAMMSVNRYRLASLARKGDRRAKRVLKLLETPDRLIGLILLGNNFTNILITQLATYIAYRLYGDVGVAVAAGALTFLLLVFAELAPKTLAVTRSRRFSLLAALLLAPLMVALYPLVWLVNLIANGLLGLAGVERADGALKPLSADDLRAALSASGRGLQRDYADMLSGILDLEKRTVEDIMIPRNKIFGIDLDAPAAAVRDELLHTNYTRVPLFRSNLDALAGFLHVRAALPLIESGDVDAGALEKMARAPHFFPESTTLYRALLVFKNKKRRSALVVDEYGAIKGLITLEDVLEEIIGEFTNDPGAYDLEMERRADGSVIVDGSCRVDDLNRAFGWALDAHGAKTVNGLLLERLEAIPAPGTGVLINGLAFEIIKTGRNTVRKAKIVPHRGAAAGAETGAQADAEFGAESGAGAESDAGADPDANAESGPRSGPAP